MGPKRNFLIAGFDTETDGLDGRFLMGQLYHEYWKKPESFRDHHDLLNRIFILPDKILSKTIWYAHNSEYDWRYIIETLPQMGYILDLRERMQGKYYEIRVLSQTRRNKKGEPILVTRFRDSMAIYEHSLAKFTKEFAPEYAKLDIGLGSGVIFNPNNKVHVAYAENDVLGNVKAIQKYDDVIYENFHVHIKGTGSGTAYQGWLRFAPEGEYHDRQPTNIEHFLRLCYHGGIVSLNALVSTPYDCVHTLDINSSYPFNMRAAGVPRGKAKKTYDYIADCPGFYQTIANVPDDAILPIVPYRSERNQLAWQTGRFVSNLSSVEIEYCRGLGVEFEIVKGVYFPEGITYCFSEFIDACEKLRNQYKGQPAEVVVKRMQNSLYGRFGMKLEGREYLVDAEGEPDGFQAAYDPANNVTIPDVYVKNVIRSAEYMLPHYSAWITANARILLDKATEMAGRENVLYRDTDSIHTIGSLDRLAPMISKIYGGLKVEDEKFDAIYHAPKCYTYRDKNGEMQATYKGIPASFVKMPDTKDIKYAEKKVLRDTLIAALHAGEHIEVDYHSSTSLQTFMRTRKMYFDRKRRPTDPSMVYGHIIEDGKFRPRRAVPWNENAA